MEGPPSDAALLVGVAGRDIGAFRTLYERHAGWLALRCNDSEFVADAVQDTFVAIWQKPRSFAGDGDVAAWLWGIAIRRLVSRLPLVLEGGARRSRRRCSGTGKIVSVTADPSRQASSACQDQLPRSSDSPGLWPVRAR